MVRFLDIGLSIAGLAFLFPVFLIVAACIAADGKGGVFFVQERVGRHGKPFGLLKFRTMRPGSEAKGQLTVGGKDPRITRVGFFLRKYKLDELPQLINVLKGEMSIVGPRPEVKKYVDLYTEGQRKVLEVRPGITDNASIVFSNENEILGKSSDPEKTYVHEIMPKKIALNMEYISDPSVQNYLRTIYLTLRKIWI